MAVNRQDPDFLSSQVDSAAESMRQTEKAVSELQHLTGLGEQLEEPPAILETDLRGVLRNDGLNPSLVVPTDLPAWFPPWASQLADLYFSGTTAAFVLCGNTYDLFRIGGDDGDADTACWRSSWPSSCSAGGRWCSTTTWAAGCARSPGATNNGSRTW